MKLLPLQSRTRSRSQPKISKTTPCKVTGRSLACAMPATTFDTSGKSAALIYGADSLRRAGIHFTLLTFLQGSKALANVRFAADSGLKSDIASRPKSATRSTGRRNTGVKSLGGGFECWGFAWRFV